MYTSNTSKKCTIDDFDRFCFYIFDVRNSITDHSVHEEVFRTVKRYIEDNFFRDAEMMYCASVFADEIILAHKWHASKIWCDQLIESALFNTNIAGDEVFERIDQILARPIYSSIDIAKVYFRMLSLGFQGKYRNVECNHIYEYIEHLYQYILAVDQKSLLDKKQMSGYEQYAIQRSFTREKLSNENLIMQICLMCFAVFIVVSSVVWYAQTKQTNELIHTAEYLMMEKTDV